MFDGTISEILPFKNPGTSLNIKNSITMDSAFILIITDALTTAAHLPSQHSLRPASFTEQETPHRAHAVHVLPDSSLRSQTEEWRLSEEAKKKGGGKWCF